VARLLENLRVEQTQSRPRHSNDNGLVEAKNGRGSENIWATGISDRSTLRPSKRFRKRHLNPYLNFHRPCGVPELQRNAKGKQRQVYHWYATPWEILRQLLDLARHLCLGVSHGELERLARAERDTPAEQMQRAKRTLFAQLQRKRSA